MEKESEKYKQIITILRKSKPVLDTSEDIEREVMKRISAVRKSRVVLSDVIDFLFGWVYIGWVRRSLITASVLLVIIFVYQQGIILRQINFLSSKMIVTGSETNPNPVGELEKGLLMYKLSGRRFQSQDITISEKDLKQLLESVNELQYKYKNLLNIIEEDPVLKKYLEERLSENNRVKNNL